MNTANKCPECGAPLPPNAPEGLCPRCLMEMNLATPTLMNEDGSVGRIKFEAPNLEEIIPLFPQLEIIEQLGQGGMGVVYKARQKELDRVVALKILPKEIGQTAGFAERFAREARALGKLNHPNIVTLYEFGHVDAGDGEPLYYFLMEYVDGLNLRRLLNNGRVEAREALSIVPQICDALQYAHDEGIVHRDIKPENILLDRRGNVKVADFGLAKIVEEKFVVPPLGGSESEQESRLKAGLQTSAESQPLSLSGDAILGTPKYMSPEQVEAPGEVDHRADIYALGVVFYQMLTGEMPDDELRPPSSKVHIDVRLDEVVLRALEQKPDLRYQQASVLKTEVETIVAEATKAEDGGQRTEVNAGTSGLKKFPLISLIVSELFLIGYLLPLLSGLLRISFLGVTPLGILLIICFSGFLNFYAVKKASNEAQRLILKTATVTNIVIWIAAVSLSLFFIKAMAHDTGGWNPAPAEAYFIVMSMLGVLVLPFCGRQLFSVFRRSSNNDTMPLMLFVGFVAIIGVIVFTSLKLSALRTVTRVTFTNTGSEIIMVKSDNRGTLTAIPQNGTSFVEGVAEFQIKDAQIEIKRRISVANRGTNHLVVAYTDDRGVDRKLILGENGTGWFSRARPICIGDVVMSIGQKGSRSDQRSELEQRAASSQKLRKLPSEKIIKEGPADINSPESSPVMERTVFDDGNDRDVCIDLDTGEFKMPPDGIMKDSKLGMIWVRENGIDAMCDSAHVKGLIGIDLIVVPLDFRLDDAPNGSLNATSATLQVDHGDPGFPVPMPEIETAYAFKTREGGRGILEITDFDPEADCVKIRYRLLERSGSHVMATYDSGEEMRKANGIKAPVISPRYIERIKDKGMAFTWLAELQEPAKLLHHSFWLGPNGELEGYWGAADGTVTAPGKVDFALFVTPGNNRLNYVMSREGAGESTKELVVPDFDGIRTWMLETVEPLDTSYTPLWKCEFWKDGAVVKTLLYATRVVGDNEDLAEPQTPDLSGIDKYADKMIFVPDMDVDELKEQTANPAEEKLKLVERKYAAGLVAKDELLAARCAAEVSRAEQAGDFVKVAEVQLEYARKQLTHVEACFKAGIVGSTEVEEAKLEVKRRELDMRVVTSGQGRAFSSQTAPDVLPRNTSEVMQFRWIAATNDTVSPVDVLADPKDPDEKATLRVLREVVMDQSDIASAEIVDSAGAGKTILLILTDRGKDKFGPATANNIGRRLAICWNGRVVSAPTVRGAIYGGRISITGSFSDDEIRQLQQVLSSSESNPATGRTTASGHEETHYLGEWIALDQYAFPGGDLRLRIEKGGQALLYGHSVQQRIAWTLSTDELLLRTENGDRTVRINQDGLLTWHKDGVVTLKFERVEGVENKQPPANAEEVARQLEARLTAAKRISSFSERDKVLKDIAVSAGRYRNLSITLTALRGISSFTTRDKAASQCVDQFIAHGMSAEATQVANTISSFNARDQVLARIARGNLNPNNSETQIKATQKIVSALSSAIDCFQLDVGRYPAEQEGLDALVRSPELAGWNGPYVISGNGFVDSWGTVLKLTSSSGKGYRILSAGPDKRLGTSDDIGAGRDEAGKAVLIGFDPNPPIQTGSAQQSHYSTDVSGNVGDLQKQMEDVQKQMERVMNSGTMQKQMKNMQKQMESMMESMGNR